MKSLIYTLIIFVFVFGNAQGQNIPEYETYTLKNGLKIYLLKYGKIEAINVQLVVNSGKKNETPGQQGYNYIVANMILKGNKKFSEEVQNDKAFALGCDLNTNAGVDYTSISCNLKTKDAPKVFEILSAAILQPLFEKEKTDQLISLLNTYTTPSKMNIRELTYIYSELAIYGVDNPLGRYYYSKQLKQITPEKLKGFYDFNYTPKNTRVIICGNFNSNEIKKIIEENFGNWQSAYGEVNGVELEIPKIKKQENYFVNRSGATQSSIRWTKNAPAINDKDILSFKIANQLFNDVLFKEIREKGGKTYGISSIPENSKFSNLFYVTCSVRSEVLLSTLELFDKTLADFSLGNFTKEDFDIEITRYRVDLITNEYPEEIGNFYNPLIYDFNKRKNTLNELNKITMEDVKAVIKKYFTPGVYKLVIAGDENVLASQLSKINNLKKLVPADLEYKVE